MNAEIKNGMLIITIPCETKDLKPSASGKTLRIASTEGNRTTDLKVAGKNVVIGLNAYISNK